MFGRALSAVPKRLVGLRSAGAGDGVGHQKIIRTTPLLPSAAAAPIITTSIHVPCYHGQRCGISTSKPLQSSADGGSDGGESSDGEGKKDKAEIIQRWMKWNTSKTWVYEPNRDLIARIGREGTTSPLDQFRDLVPREKRESEIVGRSWSAKELRRKSYDDLHKLWYVLYKEKNMLLTESNLARRHGYDMVQPERRRKVRKSMGAIKCVLGERKRKKIADHKAYLKELERFEGLMKQMKLEGDPMEEAMDAEAEKMSTDEKA